MGARFALRCGTACACKHWQASLIEIAIRSLSGRGAANHRQRSSCLWLDPCQAGCPGCTCGMGRATWTVRGPALPPEAPLLALPGRLSDTAVHV